MSDTAKHFKTLNHISENNKKILDYYYIKQKFNYFINEELSHNL